MDIQQTRTIRRTESQGRVLNDEYRRFLPLPGVGVGVTRRGLTPRSWRSTFRVMTGRFTWRR
jgi:hypothetical protein